MAKFVKKPVEVEAVRLTWGNCSILCNFKGAMIANKGDWIIKSVNGQFSVCKPDIFEKTYEKIEEI